MSIRYLIALLALLVILVASGCNSAGSGPGSQPPVLPQATAPAVATAPPRATVPPAATDPPRATAPPAATAPPRATAAPAVAPSTAAVADVTAVRVSGEAGAYQFAVEISSPDTGCEQYADWWEVVTEEGELLYRRVLLHSHVTEQPFTRSGGPVAADPDETLIVRAHMNNGGYGGQALRGTVDGGFEPVALEAEFAADLESAPPLPDGCGF